MMSIASVCKGEKKKSKSFQHNSESLQISFLSPVCLFPHLKEKANKRKTKRKRERERKKEKKTGEKKKEKERGKEKGGKKKPCTA